MFLFNTTASYSNRSCADKQRRDNAETAKQEYRIWALWMKVCSFEKVGNDLSINVRLQKSSFARFHDAAITSTQVRRTTSGPQKCVQPSGQIQYTMLHYYPFGSTGGKRTPSHTQSHSVRRCVSLPV